MTITDDLLSDAEHLLQTGQAATEDVMLGRLSLKTVTDLPATEPFLRAACKIVDLRSIGSAVLFLKRLSVRAGFIRGPELNVEPITDFGRSTQILVDSVFPSE